MAYGQTEVKSGYLTDKSDDARIYSALLGRGGGHTARNPESSSLS